MIDQLHTDILDNILHRLDGPNIMALRSTNRALFGKTEPFKKDIFKNMKVFTDICCGCGSGFAKSCLMLNRINNITDDNEYAKFVKRLVVHVKLDQSQNYGTNYRLPLLRLLHRALPRSKLPNLRDVEVKLFVGDNPRHATIYTAYQDITAVLGNLVMCGLYVTKLQVSTNRNISVKLSFGDPSGAQVVPLIVASDIPAIANIVNLPHEESWAHTFISGCNFPVKLICKDCATGQTAFPAMPPLLCTAFQRLSNLSLVCAQVSGPALIEVLSSCWSSLSMLNLDRLRLTNNTDWYRIIWMLSGQEVPLIYLRINHPKDDHPHVTEGKHPADRYFGFERLNANTEVQYRAQGCCQFNSKQLSSMDPLQNYAEGMVYDKRSVAAPMTHMIATSVMFHQLIEISNERLWKEWRLPGGRFY